MAIRGHITVGELLLGEYQVLKEEQRARIGFRDNLLYASLGSMAAVVAAVIGGGPHLQLLLLLPPVSLLLGWTYLVNDQKISAIGRYIREELTPRLTALTDSQESEPIFGWETVHRSDRRRTSRKWLQFAVDLLTFCGTSMAAVVVFWAMGPVEVALLTVSLAEVAGIIVLAVQIALYAELRTT
ncbi:hypothetical protein [Streptomyces sp. NBC_00557]|uniref:hypothetical protein n=1 Tax=Streptomyces sp. NBC_00557 TaxID=2975776 RepID=UPI002E81549F|nr:hypothetical protein [Streptomyces sp. NBC_00557]WUC34955.1 hypothetical protein OG956_12380 [Streptomyces sp. NBC_00557]